MSKPKPESLTHNPWVPKPIAAFLVWRGWKRGPHMGGQLSKTINGMWFSITIKDISVYSPIVGTFKFPTIYEAKRFAHATARLWAGEGE